MSNPPDNNPSSVFPERYLSSEVSDRVIQSILDTINQHGLTSHQAQQVLARVRDLIDAGELIARKTTHLPYSVLSTRNFVTVAAPVESRHEDVFLF